MECMLATREEFQACIRVSKSKFYKLAKEPGFPCPVRLDGCLRYFVSDIKDWVDRLRDRQRDCSWPPAGRLLDGVLHDGYPS